MRKGTIATGEPQSQGGYRGTQVFLAAWSGGRVVNPRLLFRNETAVAFTPAGGGKILFVRNDNLYAHRLDLKARKLLGHPELLQEQVTSYAGPRQAYFSVSRNGTLVWRSGTAVVSQVTVFDRKGNRLGIAGSPAPVNKIALAPDESRLAVYGEDGVWIVDAHGPGRVRLSPDGYSGLLWTPDGSRLLFVRNGKLWEVLANGSGQTRESADAAIRDAGPLRLNGIYPDGRRVLFRDGTSLFMPDMDSKAPEWAVGERSDNAALSPDATWVVYTPRNEPVLQAQPVTGATVPRQIAPSGSYSVWRGDGKEILYLFRNGLDAYISAVRVQGSGKDLQFGAPETLFAVAPLLGTNSFAKPLAVSRDGSRIYVLQSTEEPESGVIQVRTGAIR